MHVPSKHRRMLLTASGALAASGILAPRVRASTPMRVILPLGAGSGVDVIIRSASAALSKALDGQAVVVENYPGAGGITGTQTLVNARPDGNTIGFVSNNHAVNPSVYRKIPYDGLEDITPITVVGGSPFVLVVNPAKVPAKTAKELQAMLKSRPDAYNYGSSGNGTIIHLAGQMFIDAIGVSVRHVPYKGMGPMIADLLSGQIEVGVGAVAAVQAHLRSGALRAIGVMGKERVSTLPELPTIAEQGFPEVDIAGWFAAVGPKALPPDHLARLHKAIVAAFNDPDVRAGFIRRDDFLTLGSPAQAAAFLASEQVRYAKLVQHAGVSME